MNVTKSSKMVSDVCENSWETISDKNERVTSATAANSWSVGMREKSPLYIKANGVARTGMEFAEVGAAVIGEGGLGGPTGCPKRREKLRNWILGRRNHILLLWRHLPGVGAFGSPPFFEPFLDPFFESLGPFLELLADLLPLSLPFPLGPGSDMDSEKGRDMDKSKSPSSGPFPLPFPTPPPLPFPPLLPLPFPPLLPLPFPLSEPPLPDNS